MEIIVFIFYAAVMMFIFLLGNFLIFSGRGIFRLIFSCVVGVLLLCAINLLGVSFGLHMPINLITVLIASVLGIPGVILLGVILA